MEWKPITTATPKSETGFTCMKCGIEYHMHPNYIKAGILGCARCYGTETMAQYMTNLRGWKFLGLIKVESAKVYSVKFICDKNHETTLGYANLKQGSSCKICINEIKSNSTNRKIRLTRVHCSCPGSSRSSGPPCPHHNHSICQYGGAFEWNAEMNLPLTPDKVSPKTDKKYWYTCSNEWCNMNYLQSPNTRTAGSRCPYCSGNEVCHWNCLLTNYPELCLELDPENEIKPDKITPGSGKNVSWICHNHKESPSDEPFRYIAQIRHRTVNGSKCPRCAKGGEQYIMGHEYFVKESNRVHNNAYIYNEKYRGVTTPIEIYCPKISEGETHGVFRTTPSMHKAGTGCPRCTREALRSGIMQELHNSLLQLGYVFNKDFFEEVSFTGLVHRRSLRIDVALVKENAAIERDGQYHFFATHYDTTDIDKLKDGQTRDLLKDKFFLENGMNLMRLPYNISYTKDLVAKFIDLCRTGKQIYMSYQHYRDKLEGIIDFSNVCVIIVPSPTKTVVAI